MRMDNKQKLVHILCERKEAVSSKELVKVLNVSDRMIENMLNRLIVNQNLLSSLVKKDIN